MIYSMCVYMYVCMCVCVVKYMWIFLQENMRVTNETPSSDNITAQVSIGLASLQVVCN